MFNRIATPFCYGFLAETQRRKASVGSGGNHCVSICIDGYIFREKSLRGMAGVCRAVILFRIAVDIVFFAG